jgi:hypothetical protein
MGKKARRYAHERFSLARFVAEWNETFQEVAGPIRPTRLQERTAHVATHCTH